MMPGDQLSKTTIKPYCPLQKRNQAYLLTMFMIPFIPMFFPIFHCPLGHSDFHVIMEHEVESLIII